MEKQVQIFSYEENVPEDLNNLQTYVQDSMDHIVSDALMIDPRFVGFTTGKSAPVEVTVQPGRYYYQGRVYVKNETTQFNFVANLPITGKRVAIISVWGREVQTDPTPRNVLIASASTPTNPVYQPQILEKTQMREAVLGTTFSNEAPDPSDPVIAAGQLPIARVLLNNAGVESVVMFLDNILLNLAEFDGSLDKFLEFQQYAAYRLDALTSDVAGIWNYIKTLNKGDSELMGRVLGRLAILEANSGIPSNAADSSADFFLNPATSDITNPISDCRISEGIRFAFDGRSQTSIQLFNPIDPQVKVANGLILPAYDPVVRQTTGPQHARQQISAYQYQQVDMQERSIARSRIRWGSSQTVCTNSAFWQSGNYDPTTGIFTHGGETFKVISWDGKWVRLHQYWEDHWTEYYWEAVTNTYSIQGASVAESFYVGQDYWLDGISVIFTALDNTNPCSMVLMECEATGEPNVKKAFSHVTLSRTNLTVGKTKFTFPKPVFMEAGKRYAFQIITNGNHEIATSVGSAFAQGMYFGITGGYPVPDPSRHICAEFHACHFKSNTAYIDLQGLQLVGGIVDIDILTGCVVPSSAKMTFQVQSNGKWLSLDAVTAGELNAGGALPPLLPFRVVMTGTQECMPAIDTTQSWVEVSRPKKAWKHVWPANPRTPPAPSQSIRMMIRYENYDPLHHTVGAQLVDGNNTAAPIAPSSMTDHTPEQGVLERTYVWNTASALASYKVITVGATDTPLITFHAAWCKDWVI